MSSNRDGGQQSTARTQPTRNDIALEGFTGKAERKTILPEKGLVLADLSGNAGRVEDDPQPMEISSVNFNTVMEKISPTIQLKVENVLSGHADKSSLEIELKLKKMKDFEPDAIARLVPELAQKLRAREQLSALLALMGGKKAAEDELIKLLRSSQRELPAPTGKVS